MVSGPQVWKGSDHRCIVDPAAQRAEEAEAAVAVSWQQ